MRLHRADPLINDAIEALDQRLAQAKHTLPKGSDDERKEYAWTLLSAVERQFVYDETARCVRDRVYYLQNYHVIQPEGGVLTCMAPLYDLQWMIEEMLARKLAEEGRAFLVIDKPRQSGGTEYCNGVMCWRTFFLPNAFTLSVAQNPKTAAWIQRKVNIAYENLPWWMRAEKQYHTRGEYLEYSRKDESRRFADPGLGTILVTTHSGETGGVAIGRTVRSLHMCLSESNFVIDSEGYHKSISSVVVGSTIRTPTGLAKITAFTSKDAATIYPGSEIGYRITPWCGSAFPIEGTGNHRVMVTERVGLWRLEKRRKRNGEGISDKSVVWTGMCQLADLTKGHELVYPVRPITRHGVGCNVFSESLSGHERRQKGGVISRWTPPKPSREFGFAIGLYLAEGCISRNRHGCLSLALDSDERQLADRFAACVGMKYSRDLRSPSRTVDYNFYSAALSGWFDRYIGCKDFKHIPQWAWTNGKEFAKGIVEGMILGDGHVNPKFHIVQFTTIRAHLAVELRDLVASLGFGWGGLHRREAGIYYGRNCRTRFDLIFNRYSNDRIRKEFGWKPSSYHDSRDRELTHWTYSDDKTKVFVAIRKIERVPLDCVYDIEVDSPEHEFLLPCVWTHNSETSRWPASDIFSSDIKPSLEKAPDPIVLAESTPNGMSNFHHDLWVAATDDHDEDTDWTPLFLPAYRDSKNRRRIRIAQQPFVLTEEEQKVQARVQIEENFTIPPEFWNFRRRGIKDSIAESGFPYGHLECYAITARESFQASGYSAFARHKLDQQESNVRKPLWVGEIVYQGRGAIPKIHLEYMLDKEGRYRDVMLPKRGSVGSRFYLWQQPDSSAIYYIGADAGEGIGQDFSVAEILRAGFLNEPDIQVAEWVGNDEPPEAFGRILYAIGHYFNRSEIAVEYNGPGRSTADHLMNQLEYPNLYIPRHTDRFKGQFAAYMHWQTTPKTKPLLRNKMNETLLEDGILIQSEYLLNQLRACEAEGESFSAMEGNDDAAVSMTICLYCLRQTAPDLRRPVGQSASTSTSSTSATALVKALHPPLGAVIYGVYDPLYRLRHQKRSLQEAEDIVKANPGWQIRPICVSKANTAFSVIHHGRGLEHELYAGGMADREITPQIVTQYAAATGRLDGMFRGQGWGAASPGADAAQWDSNLGDLGGGELGEWSEMV